MTPPADMRTLPGFESRAARAPAGNPPISMFAAPTTAQRKGFADMREHTPFE